MTWQPMTWQVLPKRERSLSNIWDWGLGREEMSPNSSRDNSQHGGNILSPERAAGKAMPWAVKLQFGQTSERPV